VQQVQDAGALELCHHQGGMPLTSSTAFGITCLRPPVSSTWN
jgi:hypothetical protein